MSLRAPLSAALFCATGLIQAQTSGSPSELPSAGDLDAAMSAVQRRLPGMTAVPGHALDASHQLTPDLSALARQYAAIRSGKADAAAGVEPSERQLQGLLIFASLGMPGASLERLVADAERLRATLVLRGMHGGSLKATKARIQELSGARKVGWQIDPTLFERFQVAGVPTFVLIDPARPVNAQCVSGTCEQPSFSKVVGDVTTVFALSDMARRDTAFAALARRLAEPLGGLR